MRENLNRVGYRIRNILALIPKPTYHVSMLVLAHKVVLLVFLILIPELFPKLFIDQDYFNRRFTTWDTKCYLEIASAGYAAGDSNCAFYPLWPACIRVGSLITGGNKVLAAYLLANLFSFVGLLLFHRLIWEKYNLHVANRATLLLLLYPGSIFFFIPYTESLFLVLLMICLYCRHREILWGVAVAGYFLPMTRAIGCFILLVFILELYLKRAPFKSYAICLAPWLGYTSYFFIMDYYTGNPFEGFSAQQNYPAQPSVGRIFDIVGFAQSFANIGWEHDQLNSPIDRFAFVAFLCSLYWIWRLDKGFFVYALLAGLIPAFSNILMSYTRFLALVFPVFVVWGKAARKAWVFFLLLLFFWGLQIWFLLRHISGRWAG